MALLDRSDERLDDWSDEPVRYPLRALADRLRITLGHIGGQQPGQLPEGLADLADRTGMSHRTARRLHQLGMTWEQADRYALAAGLHPAWVWPDWSASAPGEEDLFDKRCRCRPALRRPRGVECDRCGRRIGGDR